MPALEPALRAFFFMPSRRPKSTWDGVSIE